MQLLMIIAGGLFIFCVVVYLHAIWKFHQIIHSEKPEWLQRRGSLSFIYDGLPRLADPNVGWAVLRAAFSPRIRELYSPLAAVYAHRIRVLLPVALLLFTLIVIVIALVKP
jgi:hypothetical protein